MPPFAGAIPTRIDWTGATPPGQAGQVSYQGLTSGPGRTFVPAPTPWQAGVNTLLRNILPWGGEVDESPTGYAGGMLGTLGRNLPFVGLPVGIGEAMSAAQQKQGQMVEIQPRDRFGDFLTSIGNTLRMLSFGGVGGAGLNLAKNLLAVGRGLYGNRDIFGFGPGEAAGGAAGMGTRALAQSFSNRPSPPGPTGAPVTPGGSGVYSSEPYTPGQYEWALNPELNPGGFPTLGGVPSTVDQSSNPFYNPDTGITPPWALSR